MIIDCDKLETQATNPKLTIIVTKQTVIVNKPAKEMKTLSSKIYSKQKKTEKKKKKKTKIEQRRLGKTEDK